MTTLGPIAFFCSQSCPGDIILKVQDWANARLPDSQPIISGFHTAIERDVLRILLRNHAPVIYCLARALEGARLSTAVRAAERAGHAEIISPFPASQKRTTAASAHKRNQHILTLCDAMLIAHASPGGKTEALAEDAIASGKRVLALASCSNDHLSQLGAEMTGTRARNIVSPSPANFDPHP
jgi:predicted Rossmann fold nucleotide-binding protein DprA/Smf involved in DNA uptake